MGILERLHTGIDSLSELPPLLRWRKRRFDARFESCPGHNLCRGVYRSFEDAARAAPRTRPHGYDNPASAQMYEHRRKRLHTTDYPPLFWLSRILATENVETLVDFGGHHGLSYYAYSRHMELPAQLRWVVSDVPAVAARGRVVAATEDTAKKLSFVDSLAATPAADVFFANGSLQYLKEPLIDVLRQLPSLPRHVIVNMLPVHESKDYFTVQEIGTAFCPYHIVAETQLRRQMMTAGYELIDRWENPKKYCTIEFEPEHSIKVYFGFYFRSTP